MRFKIWIENSEQGFTVEPSQGDGWIIRTPHGHIDYRHDPEENVNEIWWVESHKKGHGSELVDLMQKQHPAEHIAWGMTFDGGRGLMQKWHRNNPQISHSDTPHDGQYDPSANAASDYGLDDPDL